MSFFNTLKDNLTGSGVKLSLSSPLEFSLSDTTLSVELTIIAKEPRVIKNIEYRLYKNAKDAGRRQHDGYDSGSILNPIAQLYIEGPLQVTPEAPLVRKDQLNLSISEELKKKSIDERKYDIKLDAYAQIDGILVNATVQQKMRCVNHATISSV